MKHLIVLLALALSWSTPASSQQLTEQQRAELTFGNIVKNPGFENGTVYWTAAGSSTWTTTATAASVGRGARGGSWDPAAASDTLTGSQVTVPRELYGVLCRASIVYKGSGSSTTFQVIDGSVSVLASRALAFASNHTLAEVFFVCPTSGTMAIRLTASANDNAALIDSAFIGQAATLGGVLQVESSSPTGIAGRVYYDSSDKKPKFYDGTSWSAFSSSSGELNVVTNPSDANNWGATGSTMTVTTNTTAGNNPLNGVISSSIKFTSQTTSDYGRYRWTMPTALKNRKLKVEWHQLYSTGATGDFKVEVQKHSDTGTCTFSGGSYTEMPLSTDVSGDSNIPSFDGKYTTTFDADSGDCYELRVIRTAGTSKTIYLANVIVGPGIQPQGAIVGPWIAYTPTGTWITNTTYVDSYYRRVGENMEARGRILLSGAPTTATLQVNYLPSGLTYNGTTGGSTGVPAFGTAVIRDSGTRTYPGIVHYAAATQFYIVHPETTGSTNSLVEEDAPFTFGSADSISWSISVPIQEWSGSGTVSLIQDETLSDWASYTPTSTWVSNATHTGRWRRVGSDMEVEVSIALTGAPTSASLRSVTLPTGYTIDGSALASGLVSDATTGYGSFTAFDTSAADAWHGVVTTGSVANTLQPILYNQFSTTYIDGSVVNATIPFTFASGDRVTMRAKLPITEWRGKNGGGLIGLSMASSTNSGLVSTGTQTIAGTKTFSDGIDLPGGTLTTTWTYNSGGGTSSSTTVAYRKMGPFLIVSYPSVTKAPTSGSNTNFTTDTALPAAYRPTASQECTVSVDDNGLPVAGGQLRLTTGGQLQLFKTPGHSAFTTHATNVAGIDFPGTCVYYLN
jgi:hypothetical protein